VARLAADRRVGLRNVHRIEAMRVDRILPHRFIAAACCERTAFASS